MVFVLLIYARKLLVLQGYCGLHKTNLVGSHSRDCYQHSRNHSFQISWHCTSGACTKLVLNVNNFKAVFSWNKFFSSLVGYLGEILLMQSLNVHNFWLKDLFNQENQNLYFGRAQYFPIWQKNLLNNIVKTERIIKVIMLSLLMF